MQSSVYAASATARDFSDLEEFLDDRSEFNDSGLTWHRASLDGKIKFPTQHYEALKVGALFFL